MKKNKGGRRTVMTDIVVKKLEEAFSFGANDSQACFQAGISRETFYNYLEKFPNMRDRFDQLKDSPIFRAKRAVVLGFDGNPELALKYLERKLKHEFSVRQELTGAEGKDLKINLIDNFVNNNIIDMPKEDDNKLSE